VPFGGPGWLDAATLGTMAGVVPDGLLLRLLESSPP
jgi:hypothetical protein